MSPAVRGTVRLREGESWSPAAGPGSLTTESSEAVKPLFRPCRGKTECRHGRELPLSGAVLRRILGRGPSPRPR
jgi:hypothetical protein